MAWHGCANPLLRTGGFVQALFALLHLLLCIAFHSVMETNQVCLERSTEVARSYYNFETLDQIFVDFLDTNIHQGKTATLNDLLLLKDGNPVYFLYEHAQSKYLASVFCVKHYDGDWLNIKLCNNDVRFLQKKDNIIRSIPSPYYQKKPQLENEECMKYFTQLKVLWLLLVT